mgnify:CR=1 FL=1
MTARKVLAVLAAWTMLGTVFRNSDGRYTRLRSVYDSLRSGRDGCDNNVSAHPLGQPSQGFLDSGDPSLSLFNNSFLPSNLRVRHLQRILVLPRRA